MSWPLKLFLAVEFAEKSCCLVWVERFDSLNAFWCALPHLSFSPSLLSLFSLCLSFSLLFPFCLTLPFSFSVCIPLLSLSLSLMDNSATLDFNDSIWNCVVSWQELTVYVKIKLQWSNFLTQFQQFNCLYPGACCTWRNFNLKRGKVSFQWRGMNEMPWRGDFQSDRVA